jgi:hypothetical protein
MANSRELVQIILFNGQALFSNRLYEPETKDMAGKPLEKPSFSLNIRYPKTKANWYEEPALKPFVDACKVVMTRDMQGVPFARIEFPIKDGDFPNKNGKVPDWAKGHWYIRSSSTQAPKVEQIAGGVQSELPALTMGGKHLWGDGDYVAAALSIGKRLTDSVGIRCYLNNVLFTGKGQKIVTGVGSVDWASAMELARSQGIDIKTGGDPGFSPGASAGGGFNPGAFNPGATEEKTPF